MIKNGCVNKKKLDPERGHLNIFDIANQPGSTQPIAKFYFIKYFTISLYVITKKQGN